MMNNYKIENEQKMSGMECVTDSNCAIMGGASLVDTVSLDSQPNLASMFSPTMFENELYSTQGRKGHKLKRINMAFSDPVYAYIKYESRRRGLSATHLVNSIISEYMNSPQGHIG